MGIVATNLPILRPLIFTRSFSGGSTEGGTRGRSTHLRSQNGKAIPLYEVPEYGGHTVVSAGRDKGSEATLENGIMKSVEVRVESESVNSSIDTAATRKESFVRL